MAKRGRPRKIIDYEMVKSLATIHCTIHEIADFLEVSHDVLERDKEFSVIYKKHFGKGKCSLRRTQWKLAEEGNVTMAIWLGKQILGQSDKNDLNLSGDVGVKIINDIQ